MPRNRLMAVVCVTGHPSLIVRFVRLRGGRQYDAPTLASRTRFLRVVNAMRPAPAMTLTEHGMIYHVPMPAPFGGPRSLNPVLAEAIDAVV